MATKSQPSLLLSRLAAGISYVGGLVALVFRKLLRRQPSATRTLVLARAGDVFTNRLGLGKAAFGKGVEERDAALDVLERHGLQAYFYLPAVGENDQDLNSALRLLAGRGYLITNRSGDLVGKVALARPAAEEIALHRRSMLRVVSSET